jgi:hypothetical protein
MRLPGSCSGRSARTTGPDRTGTLWQGVTHAGQSGACGVTAYVVHQRSRRARPASVIFTFLFPAITD